MSDTYRTDRDGNKRKEGIHKKQKTHVCRCEYCTGVTKNYIYNKIAKKELKTEIMEKFKTVHENKSDLEQFYSKESVIKKMEIPTLINNLMMAVMQLDRYDASYNDSINLCNDGEYVKLEDVLNLFSPKK